MCSLSYGSDCITCLAVFEVSVCFGSFVVTSGTMGLFHTLINIGE